MFSQKQTSDFTHGSILSRILQISLPMTLALLINVLYNVVDRMYIGHIAGDGKLALTGVGLAFPITVMVSAFQNLCSSGGSPVFSIARGRGEREKAELALGNTYAMLLALGIVLTVVGYAVKEPVLWLIGANEETFHYANDYLNIYLLGTVFVLTSMGMNPFINAQGASRVGMLTVLLGAVVNILLDPVLIFGLGMGVPGGILRLDACVSVGPQGGISHSFEKHDARMGSDGPDSQPGHHRLYCPGDQQRRNHDL